MLSGGIASSLKLQGLIRGLVPRFHNYIPSVTCSVPDAPNTLIPTRLSLLTKHFCSSSVERTAGLNVLKDIKQININQVEVLNRGVAVAFFDHNNAIFHNVSSLKLNISDNGGNVVFTALFDRGEDPQTFRINLYGLDKDQTHLVHFSLARSPKYKSMKLLINVPPGNRIGYAVNLPGVQPTMLIRNDSKGTVLQLHASDNLSWTTEATILNAKASKKLGRMVRRKEEKSVLGSTEFHAVIYISEDILTVEDKVKLIGTCMYLMGRYQS